MTSNDRTTQSTRRLAGDAAIPRRPAVAHGAAQVSAKIERGVVPAKPAVALNQQSKPAAPPATQGDKK